jgi:Arc/MetJ family transcription regulator
VREGLSQMKTTTIRIDNDLKAQSQREAGYGREA